MTFETTPRTVLPAKKHVRIEQREVDPFSPTPFEKLVGVFQQAWSQQSELISRVATEEDIVKPQRLRGKPFEQPYVSELLTGQLAKLAAEKVWLEHKLEEPPTFDPDRPNYTGRYLAIDAQANRVLDMLSLLHQGDRSITLGAYHISTTVDTDGDRIQQVADVLSHIASVAKKPTHAVATISLVASLLSACVGEEQNTTIPTPEIGPTPTQSIELSSVAVAVSQQAALEWLNTSLGSHEGSPRVTSVNLVLNDDGSVPYLRSESDPNAQYVVLYATAKDAQGDVIMPMLARHQGTENIIFGLYVDESNSAATSAEFATGVSRSGQVFRTEYRVRMRIDAESGTLFELINTDTNTVYTLVDGTPLSPTAVPTDTPPSIDDFFKKWFEENILKPDANTVQAEELVPPTPVPTEAPPTATAEPTPEPTATQPPTAEQIAVTYGFEPGTYDLRTDEVTPNLKLLYSTSNGETLQMVSTDNGATWQKPADVAASMGLVVESETVNYSFKRNSAVVFLEDDRTGVKAVYGSKSDSESKSWHNLQQLIDQMSDQGFLYSSNTTRSLELISGIGIEPNLDNEIILRAVCLWYIDAPIKIEDKQGNLLGTAEKSALILYFTKYSNRPEDRVAKLSIAPRKIVSNGNTFHLVHLENEGVVTNSFIVNDSGHQIGAAIPTTVEELHKRLEKGSFEGGASNPNMVRFLESYISVYGADIRRAVEKKEGIDQYFMLYMQYPGFVSREKGFDIP